MALSIAYNPYKGVDWDNVTLRKFDFHIHNVDEMFDEPADMIDFYVDGTKESSEGRTLEDGEEYDFMTTNVGSDMNPYVSQWYGEHGWEFSQQSGRDWEDRDPTELGCCAYPSMEDKDDKDGGCGREYHPYSIFVHNEDLTDTEGYENETMMESIGSILDESIADGTYPEPRACIAHPGRHYAGSPREHYWDFVPHLEEYSLEDGLWGIECGNKSMDPFRNLGCESARSYWDDFHIWDALNSYFGHERPVWGFSNDDASGPSYGDYLDRRYNWIVMQEDEFDPEDQEATRQAAVDRLDDGCFFACRRDPWDAEDETESPPEIPVVESIDVDEDNLEITISIEQDEADIYWIDGPEPNQEPEIGHVAATGETVDLSDWESPFVRAHVILQNSPMGELSTQPIYLDGNNDIGFRIGGEMKLKNSIY